MPSPRPGTRPLTAQDKAQILERAVAGERPSDIAAALNCHPSQVGGVISSAKHNNLISRDIARRDEPLPRPGTLDRNEATPEANMEAQAPTTPVTQAPATAAPAPAPAQQAAQQPSAQEAPRLPRRDGGFDFRGPGGIQGPGGFSYNNSGIRYVVQREVPKDGLMGVHPHPFSVEDLGNAYGEGTYTVTREDGKASVSATQVISRVYGAPKMPRRNYDRDDGRGRGHPQDEDGMRAGGQRPYAGYPFGYQYADREAPRGSESATTEAIRQVGSLTQQVLTQNSQDRKNGPDNFMREFMQQQQQAWENRRREERDAEESRRKDEEEKSHRRADDEERRHKNDLERMRLESEARLKAEAEQRKTLVELEEKRIGLLREEFRLREEAQKKETDRVREEMRAIQESTDKRLEDHSKTVDREISAREAALQKEHDLRLRHMDREFALQEQLLKAKEEASAKSDGELIAKTLEKVAGEVSKTVRDAIELKRLEAMSPEAQAAAVARGQVDGNILPSYVPGGGERQQQAASPTQQPPPQQDKGGLATMDEIIAEQIKKPFFKGVLREWVRKVERSQDASTFASMYMEWIGDPEDYQGRKACTAFANFMSTRDWDEMYKILEPHLDAAQKAALSGKAAAEFYATFQFSVCDALREYWEMRAAARLQQQQQKQTAEAPQG